MARRKKESGETENISNSSYITDEENEGTKRKVNPGCIILIVVILIAGILGFGSIRKNAVRNVKGNPIADMIVSTGLSRGEYKSSGQQISLTDLQGNKVSDTQSNIPLSIPTSLSGDNLQALDQIAYPEGAEIDPQSGQLVVFGKPAEAGDSSSRSDFLVALQSVSNDQFPGVSIDPTQSKTVQTVRYIGPTETTHAGQVMFEADRLMKNLSLGKDNITGQAVTSYVPGHATMFDLEFQLSDQTVQEERRRFWFVVPDVEIEQNPAGDGMVITHLELAVKTEYLDANWNTLAVQPLDPAGQAYAQQLTSHFDDYAREFPVLEELRELAYWTALAQWVKQANLPIQSELWLTQNPQQVETPKTTPAITVTQQQTQANVYQTISLWGGVDLSINLNVKPESDNTKGILQQVLDWFRSSIPHTPTVMAGISPTGLDKWFTMNLPLFNNYSVRYRYAGSNAVSPGNGWLLNLPYLQIQKGTNTSQPSAYVLTDPASGTISTLTPGGKDAENNNLLYTDIKDGWRLEVQPGGLYLLRGTFTNNGTSFEYTPDQFMQFDPSGNILTRTQSASNVIHYLYKDGQLAAIDDAHGRINIQDNQNGQMTGVSQNDIQYTFTYDVNNFPAGVMEAQNQVVKQFIYDTSDVN